MPNHTEAQMNELTHRGANCGHLGFSFGAQACVERPDVWVALRGHDGRHVEHGTRSGIAVLGQSRPFLDTAAGLMFDRDQSKKRRHLIGAPELPAVQHRQHPVGRLVTHRRNRQQTLAVGFQSRMAVDMVIDRLLQPGNFPIQRSQVIVQRLPNQGGA